MALLVRALNRRDYADTYTTRGRVYFLQGEYRKAIVDFSTAIGFDPTQPRPYGPRSRIWSFWREHKRALEDAEQLVKLDPKNYYSYLVRAYAKDGAGKQKHQPYRQGRGE